MSDHDDNVVPLRKRLKGLSEHTGGPRIRGLPVEKPAQPQRGQASVASKHTVAPGGYMGIRRRRKSITPTKIIGALVATTIVIGLVLTVAVEASCRLMGDPDPRQDWRISYELGPMIDAKPIQNCRINTREYWKSEAVARLKQIKGKLEQVLQR